MNTTDKFFLCSNLPGYEDSDFGVDERAMQIYIELARKTNIITQLYCNNFHNPKHQCNLSVKCAYGEKFFIRFDNSVVVPGENSYLLLNSGTYYESWLDTHRSVEIFSVFFSSEFENENRKCLLDTDESNLSNPWYFSNQGSPFIEKLYPHNDFVTPVINRLRKLTLGFYDNINQVEELYYLLIERLYLQQDEIIKEINSIEVIKHSTKLEIYKRLHIVKDYLDSFYDKYVSLNELARLSLMNSAYLLRQFKKYFKITPYQYLIKKRMSQARCAFEENREIPVIDVCTRVGYFDIGSFRKLFKRAHGVAPEAYQRDYKAI